MSSKNLPEKRHATMADVAKHVGVSRQLVGLVFRNASGVSPETTKRIIDAAELLNYRPNLAAQALRREGSKYIGLAFHTSHSSTNELIPAIYKAAEGAGYKLVLSAISKDRQDSEAIDEIMGHRCDGLILISSSLPLARIKNLAATIPTVSISRRLPAVNCGSVTSAGESGMLEVTQHLLALGHTSITFVDAPQMFDHEFRKEGYEQAMQLAGRRPMVIEIDGDYIEESGARAAERLLNLKELPTAVICSNDQMAFGLIHALQKSGVSVPADISVAGYDDTVAKWPFLGITTVRQDPNEMAAAAVADLVSRMNDVVKEPTLTLTSARIVKRSTTAAPRRLS